MKKRLSSQHPIYFSILFTLVILVGTFFWFRSNIQRLVESITEEYLEENAKSQAAVFRTKLEDQIVMLESQARYFYDIDMTDYNETKETILSTNGISGFKTIGVASSTGSTLNYNGRSSGNILQNDYFKEAMTGVPSISKFPYKDESGDDVLAIAVPILQKETVVGVVFGTFDQNILRDLIATSSFGGEAINILASSDGYILAQTESLKGETHTIDSVFSDEIAYLSKNKVTKNELKVDLKNGVTCVAYYALGSQNKIAVLTPVGVHDWYYVTVIPERIVSSMSSQIARYMLAAVLAIALAFLLTLFAILFLIKNNETILKSNERYRMVTTQTQAIIFEYDYPKKRLELSGNVEFLMATAPELLVGDRVMDVLSLVHPDDRAIREAIKDLPMNDSTSLGGECRMRCADDNYYWFRLKASVLRSEDGHPLRFVGNLINVEEQMKEERRLKQKAEMDPLTGILNKGAMEAYVNETLNSASVEDLFAFYIVDLDNFKGVNDNLGHQVGDRVLTDVAKKLCLVFNERDAVGRIGGDEFAVFLKLSVEGRKVGDKIIESKAKALCKNIDEVYSDGKHEVHVSASIGVSIYPTDGLAYADLYRKADAALYAAKNSGKNQFFIYREETIV